MNRSVVSMCCMLLVSCAQAPLQKWSTPAHVVASAEQKAPVEPPSRPPKPLALPLASGLHVAAMTEAFLDPRGTAALTLDTFGEVRLWPELRSESARLPLILPAQEPVWLSLARVDAQSFVVAWIDMAGAAQVGRVEFVDGNARFLPLFAIPPTDSLFEIHVLDGGQRLLALGKDHRVRLYDSDGLPLSVLDKPGFAPWQLRVVQPEHGHAQVAVVLAHPVRAQALTLANDTLASVGQAWTVALDQSPNRNDLALTPDGKTIVALRRPRARGTRWELQLIDLATGERRELAGRGNTRVRPRLHLVSGARALLEPGGNKGFWVDLSLATKVADRDPDKDLRLTQTSSVPLPAADEAHRMHASVVHGLRIVPDGRRLIADLVDEPEHLVLDSIALEPTVFALDQRGERVAWDFGGQVAVEDVALASGATDLQGGVRKLGKLSDPLLLIEFLTDDRLLLLDRKGRLTVLDLSDGATVASSRIRVHWGPKTVAFRRTGPAAGTVAVRAVDRWAPMVAVEIDGTTISDVRAMGSTEVASFSEFGPAPQQLKGFELRVSPIAAVLRSPLDDRVAVLQAPARDRQSFRCTRKPCIPGRALTDGERRTVTVRAVTPSIPATDERRVRRMMRRPDSRGPVIDPDQFTVTVLDVESMQQRWSRFVGATHPRWSGDGRRIVLAGHHGGFLVVDAANGALLGRRTDLGLRVQRLPDGRAR